MNHVEIVRYPGYRVAEAIIEGSTGGIAEGHKLGHIGEPAFGVAEAVGAGEGESDVCRYKEEDGMELSVETGYHGRRGRAVSRGRGAV